MEGSVPEGTELLWETHSGGSCKPLNPTIVLADPCSVDAGWFEHFVLVPQVLLGFAPVKHPLKSLPNLTEQEALSGTVACSWTVSPTGQCVSACCSVPALAVVCHNSLSLCKLSSSSLEGVTVNFNTVQFIHLVTSEAPLPPASDNFL